MKNPICARTPWKNSQDCSYSFPNICWNITWNGRLDLQFLSVSLFNPKNPIVQFNKELHSSSTYKGFQITISIMAAFTGGFTKGMKNPVCFVSGINTD
jgi:hypothetical protein